MYHRRRRPVLFILTVHFGCENLSFRQSQIAVSKLSVYPERYRVRISYGHK